MQQTTNYKLNQIERTDKITESIDALGQNAVEIDKLLKKAEEKIDQAENILPTQKASGEHVYIDNAVNYPLMSLSGEGKSEQNTSEMIYKCDGTESGIYDLTYNSIIYEFTMPTISAESILVFNTEGLTLSLEGTQIETSIVESASGTELTFAKTPNPDYPQEIKTVTEVEYKGVKKNLINLTQLNENTLIKMKARACYATNVETNSVTLTASGTWSNLELLFPENYFAENENIVISAKFIETISGRKSPVGFVISGSNNNIDYTEIKRNYPNEINYNTSTFLSAHTNIGSYKHIRIRIWVNPTTTSVTKGESVINVSELMIARGTDPTFEPYQETTLPIDLQGNELCELDKLLIDRKGNVAIEKNLDKIVLNGSEAWVIEGLINECTLHSFLERGITKNAKADANCLSDYFTHENQNIYYKDDIGFDINWNRHLRLKISESVSTVAELKAWLSENNVTIYYELKTPEIINLGTIENPEIFKGINNIAVETNLGNMNIEVEYVEDLQKRSSSGGEGGTTDYTALTNKPKINGVELTGNKSSADLGMYTKAEINELLGDYETAMTNLIEGAGV